MDNAVNVPNLEGPHDFNLGSCTGTFITRRIVQTAAHCVGGFDGDNHYYVWLADTFDQSTEKFTGLRDPLPYKSVKAAIDPMFDINQLRNGHDIGLILVDRPLPSDTQPMHVYPMRLT